MAALLSSNLNDISTLTEYIGECHQMGINVLSPDVNESMLRFSSNANGDIRFGLGAIKGVGETAAMSIITEREKNGNYKDVYDFFERVNYSVVNRKCLESMAYAGCFDTLCSFSRCKFFAPESRDSSTTFLEMLIRYGQRIIEDKLNAQQSLFQMFADMGGANTIIQKPNPPECEEWSSLMRLGHEKNYVGIYLSAHPLDDYRPVIDQLCNATISDLEHLTEHLNEEMVFACISVSGEEKTSYDGNSQYGILKVEDETGKHDFWLRRKDFERFRNFLHPGYYLLFRGEVREYMTYDKNDIEKKNPKPRQFFNISSIQQLNDVVEQLQQVSVTIDIRAVTDEFIDEFSAVVKRTKGNTPLHCSIFDSNTGIGINMHTRKIRVLFNKELKEFFEKYKLQYTLK